jgi:hypothetical protein
MEREQRKLNHFPSLFKLRGSYGSRDLLPIDFSHLSSFNVSPPRAENALTKLTIFARLFPSFFTPYFTFDDIDRFLLYIHEGLKQIFLVPSCI